MTLGIENLRKSFGEHEVLKGISFEVEDGEIVGLLGANGAGKTTLLNCICGVMYPTGGEIRYEGASVLPESPVRRDFGVLVDSSFRNNMSVRRNLEHLLALGGVTDRAVRRRQVEEAVEFVGLGSVIDRRTAGFSFGMRQRLGLAQALVGDPRVLLLDEPQVGLDPSGHDMFRRALLDAAHERGRAILFSSHDLTDVELLCDRVVMIDSGVIVYNGTPTRNKEIVIRFDGVLEDPPAWGRVEAGTLVIPEGRVGELFRTRCLADVEVTSMDVADRGLRGLFNDVVGRE